MFLYDLFQLYNIFPKIVERIPGKHKKLFALLNRPAESSPLPGGSKNFIVLLLKVKLACLAHIINAETL